MKRRQKGVHDCIQIFILNRRQIDERDSFISFLRILSVMLPAIDENLVATLNEPVKVRTMMSPKSTSDTRSIGSSARLAMAPQ